MYVVLLCLILEAMLLHIINFAFCRKRGLFENQNVSVCRKKGYFLKAESVEKGNFVIQRYVLYVCMGVGYVLYVCMRVGDMCYMCVCEWWTGGICLICMYGSGGICLICLYGSGGICLICMYESGGYVLYVCM